MSSNRISLTPAMLDELRDSMLSNFEGTPIGMKDIRGGNGQIDTKKMSEQCEAVGMGGKRMAQLKEEAEHYNQILGSAKVPANLQEWVQLVRAEMDVDFINNSKLRNHQRMAGKNLLAHCEKMAAQLKDALENPPPECEGYAERERIQHAFQVKNVRRLFIRAVMGAGKSLLGCMLPLIWPLDFGNDLTFANDTQAKECLKTRFRVLYGFPQTEHVRSFKNEGLREPEEMAGTDEFKDYNMCKLLNIPSYRMDQLASHVLTLTGDCGSLDKRGPQKVDRAWICMGSHPQIAELLKKQRKEKFSILGGPDAFRFLVFDEGDRSTTFETKVSKAMVEKQQYGNDASQKLVNVGKEGSHRWVQAHFNRAFIIHMSGTRRSEHKKLATPIEVAYGDQVAKNEACHVKMHCLNPEGMKIGDLTMPAITALQPDHEMVLRSDSRVIATECAQALMDMAQRRVEFTSNEVACIFVPHALEGGSMRTIENICKRTNEYLAALPPCQIANRRLRTDYVSSERDPLENKIAFAKLDLGIVDGLFIDQMCKRGYNNQRVNTIVNQMLYNDSEESIADMGQGEGRAIGRRESVNKLNTDRAWITANLNRSCATCSHRCHSVDLLGPDNLPVTKELFDRRFQCCRACKPVVQDWAGRFIQGIQNRYYEEDGSLKRVESHIWEKGVNWKMNSKCFKKWLESEGAKNIIAEVFNNADVDEMTVFRRKMERLVPASQEEVAAAPPAAAEEPAGEPAAAGSVLQLRPGFEFKAAGSSVGDSASDLPDDEGMSQVSEEVSEESYGMGWLRNKASACKQKRMQKQVADYMEEDEEDEEEEEEEEEEEGDEFMQEEATGDTDAVQPESDEQAQASEEEERQRLIQEDEEERERKKEEAKLKKQRAAEEARAKAEELEAANERIAEEKAQRVAMFRESDLLGESVTDSSGQPAIKLTLPVTIPRYQHKLITKTERVDPTIGDHSHWTIFQNLDIPPAIGSEPFSITIPLSELERSPTLFFKVMATEVGEVVRTGRHGELLKRAVAIHGQKGVFECDTTVAIPVVPAEPESVPEDAADPEAAAGAAPPNELAALQAPRQKRKKPTSLANSWNKLAMYDEDTLRKHVHGSVFGALMGRDMTDKTDAIRYALEERWQAAVQRMRDHVTADAEFRITVTEVFNYEDDDDISDALPALFAIHDDLNTLVELIVVGLVNPVQPEIADDSDARPAKCQKSALMFQTRSELAPNGAIQLDNVNTSLMNEKEAAMVAFGLNEFHGGQRVLDGFKEWLCNTRSSLPNYKSNLGSETASNYKTRVLRGLMDVRWAHFKHPVQFAPTPGNDLLQTLTAYAPRFNRGKDLSQFLIQNQRHTPDTVHSCVGNDICQAFGNLKDYLQWYSGAGSSGA